MLKQRVLTALLLLSVLLPTLLVASPWPFGLFVALTIGLAAWEWARLNGAAAWAPMNGLLAVALGASAYAWLGTPAWLWQFALLVWVVGGALALRGAAQAWLDQPAGLRVLLGQLLLVPALLALIAWKAQGLNALLSVLCLVWVADVAAYFGGRRFGRRKLAPAISPGKSWEGVWSGWLGVLLLGLFWVTQIDPIWQQQGLSVFGQLVKGMGWPIAALALIVLAGLSVVGDLFESLMKRAVGAKDSSQLLPGHGGVLDRIDALLPTLPAALAFCELARGLA
jgi:phosphatidate cytidylyltransferase